MEKQDSVNKKLSMEMVLCRVNDLQTHFFRKLHESLIFKTFKQKRKKKKKQAKSIPSHLSIYHIFTIIFVRVLCTSLFSLISVEFVISILIRQLHHNCME